MNISQVTKPLNRRTTYQSTFSGATGSGWTVNVTWRIKVNEGIHYPLQKNVFKKKKREIKDMHVSLERMTNDRCGQQHKQNIDRYMANRNDSRSCWLYWQTRFPSRPIRMAPVLSKQLTYMAAYLWLATSASPQTSRTWTVIKNINCSKSNWLHRSKLHQQFCAIMCKSGQIEALLAAEINDNKIQTC